MVDEYQLEEGKGGIFENKQEDSSHDFYGQIKLKSDAKRGDIIKLRGYKNKSRAGNNYIGIQVIEPRQ